MTAYKLFIAAALGGAAFAAPIVEERQSCSSQWCVLEINTPLPP